MSPLMLGKQHRNHSLGKNWFLWHGQEGLRLESWCCAIHYKQPAAQMADYPELHGCQWHTKDESSQTGDVHYNVWQA